ncbi:MAG: SDR family oxidoreductase [Proteobacteria bacterium]|nr:SDR family oxidoreductase [Pseudomonadota bacterium]NKA01533.1 SDR family oxidoreductase [Candidatus Fonsibacter sp. PEL5]
MKRLENKSVIITAAGQGIGKETAIRFFKEGANVIATDINRTNKLEELSKEYPKIKTYTLDSTNAADIKKFANTISKVDVLFNCVGFVHNGTILECEEKDWDFSFNVNVRSMYLMIKNIIPKMINQKSGAIINMASVVSSVKGVKDRFVYGATKAAVIGLTKSIAVDFLKYNIRCNAIAPGTIHTPSWEDRVNSSKDPEKARKDFIDRQPMGRLGKPEEVAALATYLATDESAFSTGAVYSLDGGMTI